jgi:predicted esterase
MDMEEFATRIIQALQALESAFRGADPMKLSKIREGLLAHEEPLRSSRQSFSRKAGENLLHDQAILAADLTLEAVSLFGLGDDPAQAFMNALKAHRKSGKAQEALFALRNDVVQADRYFLEPDARQSFEGREDREGLTGIFHEHLKEVQSRYNIDTSRILVTGMSDGATFALGLGLQEFSPFSAIAPVSEVLAATDLSHAKGRRIYWVHGALDWMFPVGRAAHGCRMLRDAGAEVELKVIEDLSHTYPREENKRILSWFAPDLE